MLGVRMSDRRAFFVVHGHDDALKLDVARFLERLGLEAVILAEQSSGGKTVIEKFEQQALTVAFAVVLLTPDDLGRSAKPGSTEQPRARQNVILELGYFIGALGRAKVCALQKGSLEVPSDFWGVLTLTADQQWKGPLAKEMKAAGLSIDMNLAV
jgi:predicted nucleotide-binding protein